MRIVVTDSGLGGLSVLADLEKRLVNNPIYKNVELIFFNSLYNSNYGYNSMGDFSSKVTVFNNALNSIEVNYNPDLLLIACNTLSVVYPYTEFAKNSKIDVRGILDSGVKLFRKSLTNIDDIIILFGTETTIKSDVYKKRLIELGVKETQIVNRACPDLETKIQKNPNSKSTQDAISKFVKETTKSIKHTPLKVYAGLCCTHYGYSEQLFYNKLSEQFNSKVEVLNPNNNMLNFLFATKRKPITPSSIRVKIVSQVNLRKKEVELLSEILSIDSPKTASALKKYEYIENLFSKN